MSVCNRKQAFTLLELLVVVGIITVLVGILVPSVTKWADSAKSARCLSGLRHIGASIVSYQGENGNQFPPYRAAYTVEYLGTPPFTWIYFWGSATNPVNPRPSPLLDYIDRKSLLCPSLRWDNVVPQAGVIEPTTTYGYNAQCLDPNFFTRVGTPDLVVPRTKSFAIKKPAELFVFADSGLYWAPAGTPIFQNSTYLEPPDPGGGVVTPTNHFRHDGMSNALCADGHASSFRPGPGGLMNPQYKLGFVGTTNDPHYDN